MSDFTTRRRQFWATIHSFFLGERDSGTVKATFVDAWIVPSHASGERVQTSALRTFSLTVGVNRLANSFSLPRYTYTRDPCFHWLTRYKVGLYKLLTASAVQILNSNNQIFASWPAVTEVVAPTPQCWRHILWHFSLFPQFQCPLAYQQKAHPIPVEALP